MNQHAAIRSRLAMTAILVISGSLLACAPEPAIPVTESAAIRIQKANKPHGNLVRHAFDIIQDTPETRGIVAGTLDFIGSLTHQ